MAKLPEYGQKVAPAGPVPYNIGTGPLYNQGLSILASASRDVAELLANKDRTLREAYESTEITRRAAEFSLATQSLLQRAKELQVNEPGIDPADAKGNRPTITRLANPDEQKQFFEGEIGKLEQQYSEWEAGLYGRNVSTESKARLREMMIADTAQRISQFRAIQEKRQMENIRDGLQFALDAAVQTGNEAVAHESVTEAIRVDAITEAVGEQLLKEFPINVRIEELRRQAILDPDGTVQAALELQADAEATKDQRVRLREVGDLARGVRADSKTRKGQAWNALREDTFRLAHELTPEQFQVRLLQTVGITEEERAELMRTYLTAAQLYQRTGTNPWTTTQDYPSLAKAIQDVRSSRIKSLDEVDQRWLAAGQPNWSFNDWRAVTNLFEDRNRPARDDGYSRSHPVADMYFRKLTDLYADKNDYVADPETFSAKFMLLEKALSDPEVWRNPEQMQQEFDELTKDVKAKKAKGFLGAVGQQLREGPTGQPGLQPFSLASAAAGRTTRPEPKTPEDFARTVGEIADDAEARAYYDQWKDKF